MSEFDQFEEAFSSNTAGAITHCICGRIFWDTANDGWDWGDGEEDELRNNPNATGVPHATSRIFMDGIEYAMDCDCWKPRARLAMDWLRLHQRQIGEWFKLEKQRLLRASSEVPEIVG